MRKSSARPRHFLNCRGAESSMNAIACPRKDSIQFLSVCSVFLGLTVLTIADTAVVGGVTWTYKEEGNNQISIFNSSIGSYGYQSAIPTSTEGDISVPSTLDGKKVVSIGSQAFRNCTKITSLEIPSGVLSLGKNMCYSCSSLSSIIIPEGVSIIEESTFNGCSSLQSISLPSSLVQIGRSAFSGCRLLSSVDLGPNLTTIQSYAFNDCASLSSIFVPPSVTSIGSTVFYGCRSLEKLYLPSRFSGQTSNMSIPSTCSVVFYTSYSLSVSSAFGHPFPDVGNHEMASVGPIECYVAEPVSVGGVKYVCTGWIGTGSVPSSGTATNLTFSLSEDSTLTWNWKTQCLVTVSISGGACEFGSRWVDSGKTVVTEIVPEYAHYTISLSGDTNGVSLAGSSLSIPVLASGREIIVNVIPIEATTEVVDGIEWSYVASDGVATIFKARGESAIPPTTSGTVMVPTVLGGVPVTGIGDSAFSGCSGVTRLLFAGDAPDIVATDAFSGVGNSCSVHVRPGSSGWNVDFPGIWNTLPIMNDLYSLSATVVGEGTVSGSGVYVAGDEAVLSAVASPGFVFSNWSGAAAGLETETSIQITEENLTAMACFIPVAAADHLVTIRAEQNGYYTRDQIHTLSVGDLLFDVDSDSGTARVGVQLEETSDLSDTNSWMVVKFSKDDLDIGEDGSIGLSVKANMGARFFRLVAP